MDRHLVERVQAVMRELVAIRAELGTAATDPATGLAIPKLTAEHVRDFKREIDQMRSFLWACMDTWSVGSTDPRNRLQQVRMDSVAEMLRQLYQAFCITGVPPTQEGRRLSEKVRAIMPLLPG